MERRGGEKRRMRGGVVKLVRMRGDGEGKGSTGDGEEKEGLV